MTVRSSASEFIELFVGVGASRVRDIFKQAKEKARCIGLVQGTGLLLAMRFAFHDSTVPTWLFCPAACRQFAGTMHRFH